ncbi:Oxidoreductase, short-chain dehydrogenase/reductase family [hydrothermal vent metagenome]|uniref:Oxidoreductase, short-chain dehydrogenase/reductase family n=1 Tax=hydrothermal vent metagenome TaxID=652676 RepID=A0A3B0ZPR1_9ZZZZ
MNIVILGATSAIAQSVARRYAGPDVNFILVARNKEKLDIVEKDLISIGAASIDQYVLDFDEQHERIDFVDYLKSKDIKIDLVFLAYGVMYTQDECEKDVNKTLDLISSNYNSVVILLTMLSGLLIKNKSGCIAVITSVAGDRGRKSNFIYGSAKAGVTTYLEGLRYKLYEYGVSVITLKPGFIDTPMTKDCQKGLLWVSPDTAGKYIVKAIRNKKTVAYIPPFWFWIMLIIKNIPAFIFRKLNF